MYLSLTLLQGGYQVASSISFDFGCNEEGDTGLDRPLLSSHAAIWVISYQGNWVEAKFWGLCPIKTLLNIAGHKISSDLEDGALYVYCSAVKPPAHETRRLAWVLYSFKEKDNSIRVYWCLLAWPYCSVTAAKQSTLYFYNCCKVLHCFACYFISQ